MTDLIQLCAGQAAISIQLRTYSLEPTPDAQIWVN